MNDNGDELHKRYLDALHAMQSGVAQMQEIDPKSTSAKHLRTGINAAMSDHGALVSLLVNKGVFTVDEFMAEAVKFAELEKTKYEDILTRKLGVKIVLG